MLTRKSLRAAFVAVDTPATVTYAAAGPPAYCIVDLGIVVADAAIEPAAINAAGQVVGTILYTDGSAHPFLWQSGGWIYLGSPLGQYSVARAINKHGQVVGSTQALDGGCRAWLWDNGKKTELATPGPGQSAFATGINDAGQIVGGRLGDCTTPAGDGCLWQNDTPLDLTPGIQPWSSAANGINNAGQIVGVIEGGAAGRRAFVWHHGTRIDLGSLPGSVGSVALAVSDAGQVIGFSDMAFESGTRAHAFTWRNGQTRALPRPAGVETSLALGVNARGDVVGYVMGDRFGPSAVRWSGDVLTDLNAELQPDSGWVLEYASAINNAGQIVGVGRRDGARGAFLLTPLSTRAW